MFNLMIQINIVLDSTKSYSMEFQNLCYAKVGARGEIL